LAQDDYYYEIQLTNKQLVFYFMAGATGLILSFLAGVMVGRGVDVSAGEVRASHAVKEERVATEEIHPITASPTDLTYPKTLEAEKVDDNLEKPGASKAASEKSGAANAEKPKAATVADAGAAKPAHAAGPPPRPAATAPPKPTPAPTTAAAKPTPGPTAVSPAPTTSAKASSQPAAATPARTAGTAAGTFTIQVGAFKDKSGADSLAGRLKAKNFPAYVESGTAGLFNVRVGNYPVRTEADRVLTRLRDEEKFQPFIVKN
jgi:cell division septation protein DedD